MSKRDEAIEAIAKALDTNWDPDYPVMEAMFRDYAEIALEAALAVLHPHVPNTVEALDALPVGTVLRGVDQDGDLTVAMRSATGDWVSIGASLEAETDAMQTHGHDYGITEWTVIYHPEEQQ